MIDSPCHNCSERVAGCHATCEGYKSYQRNLQKLKDNARGDKEFINYSVQSNLSNKYRSWKKKNLRRR